MKLPQKIHPNPRPKKSQSGPRRFDVNLDPVLAKHLIKRAADAHQSHAAYLRHLVCADILMWKKLADTRYNEREDDPNAE